MINVLLFAMPDKVPRLDIATRIPNLGIASIAGNVDSTICNIKIADLLLIEEDYTDYVWKLLDKYNPELVGLSCMSFQYSSAVKLAKLIKEYDNKCLVALGGYHPTLLYEEIADSEESLFIDFIIRGEGEITFNELVSAVNSGSGYEEILGLSYKLNGEFYHNPPRNIISDLDKLQLPNRDARLIKDGFHVFGVPIGAVETSRGCTANCKFCSIRQMYGRSFRQYSIDRVIRDIKDARNHGAQFIVFVDDNITLNVKRLEVLCEELINSGLNNLQYFLQASVHGIAKSPLLAQKMADAGVKMVFIGIESISKKNLKFLGKSTKVMQETLKAIKYLKDREIMVWGGFIVGNPDDDEECFWEVYKTAKKLDINEVIFSILVPYAKTEIRKELVEKGLVTNMDDFSRYHHFTANVKTKHLNPAQIDEIVENMYNKYYTSWDYIKNSKIRKFYPRYFYKTVIDIVSQILKEKFKISKG